MHAINFQIIFTAEPACNKDLQDHYSTDLIQISFNFFFSKKHMPNLLPANLLGPQKKKRNSNNNMLVIN